MAGYSAVKPIILKIIPVAITVLFGVDKVSGLNSRLMLCGRCWFCFYKHMLRRFSFSSWLLEYLSVYLHLKYLVLDYAFQNLVMQLKLCDKG